MRSFPFIGIIAALGFLTAFLSLGEALGDPAVKVDYSTVSPTDLVNQTPKGKLQNPYKDSQADIVSQGEGLFRSYPCAGCHGGGAGGGMCPPLTKADWIYDGNDDTLFRLVALGSDAMLKNGYTRHGLAPAVGPMPPMGNIIKNSDELWKMLAFIRSRYDGDPAYKYGAPAAPQ